jgi:DNA-binding transcriptional ArsR family regulator
MKDEPTPELLERLAGRFAALADPTRLRLLHLLQAGEQRVGDLAEAVELGQPTVSKHLALLRQVGLVQVRRQGVEAFYAIRDQTLFELCDLVCASVRQQVAEEVAGLAISSRSRRR